MIADDTSGTAGNVVVNDDSTDSGEVRRKSMMSIGLSLFSDAFGFSDLYSIYRAMKNHRPQIKKRPMLKLSSRKPMMSRRIKFNRKHAASPWSGKNYKKE